MTVNTSQLVDFYNKFWKKHSWSNEYICIKDEVIALYFGDDMDYVYSEIGTSDPEDDYFLNVKLSEILSVFRKISTDLDIKIKNNKIQFVTTDKKTKFVVTINSEENLSNMFIPVKSSLPIELPRSLLTLVSNFSDKSYPFNLLYCDGDNKKAFATNGSHIVSSVDFDKAAIAFSAHIPKILGSLSSDCHIRLGDNNIICFYDNITSGQLKAFEPEKDINIYINMLEYPDKMVNINKSELLQALSPHMNKEIYVSKKDENLILSSSSNDMVAIQTTCAIDGDLDLNEDVIFTTNYLVSILDYFTKEEIKMFIHPKYQTIYGLTDGEIIYMTV